MRPDKSNIRLIAVMVLTVFTPFILSAQSTLPSYNQGIENCQRLAAYPLSSTIGSFDSTRDNSRSPLGGPYVPVADSAVELNTASAVVNTNSIVLNTATLVYKECVLRVVLVKQRQAATAAVVGDTIQRFASGRNGGPMFPQYLHGDVVARGDAALTRALQGPALSTIPPDYQNLIKQQIAVNYSGDTRAYNNTVACPQYSDAAEVISGQDFSFSGFLAARDPRCDPIFSYYFAQDIIQNDIGLDREEMYYRLMTGDGIYGVETFDADGNRITVLPGTFVRGNVEYALLSGYRQLENADDIGQIVDSTFATMADRAMMAGSQTPSNTPTGGLYNLTSAGSGSMNALQQVINNALQQLSNIGGTVTPPPPTGGSIEQQYHDIAVTIRTLITETTSAIQAAETKCWSDTTHSTDFIQNHTLSQINNQAIGALLTTMQTEISKSETALAANPPQQVHTQQDLTNITSLRTTLQSVMPTTIVDVATALWKTMSGVNAACGT